MSEMNELPGLYEESSDLQLDVMPGEGGRREQEPWPQLEEEGPVEEEAAQPAEQPGQLAGPDFESEDEVRSLMPGRMTTGMGIRRSTGVLPAAECQRPWGEASEMLLRTSRAREAALGGGFQMRYETTPFDPLAFVEELSSLTLVSRLTEELG
ncbi:unnamed protein product [Nyctereutes procyonoides]|uniref:(raccoon dog) hypothetical protein n=1 Tax=Nyctereutes procyonoides TaxID=34880 RepID=A0A811ZRQ7_NYCPR|nr:unnamed protein product [Nyctereutes procyonoides]